MKPLHIALALTLAATLPVIAAHAGEHRKVSRDARHAGRGMQEVAVSPAAGEPGHGWRYFSDARGARAVVISPNGDYYYSHGEGLHRVYRASTTA